MLTGFSLLIMFSLLKKLFGKDTMTSGALAMAKTRFEAGTAKPVARIYDKMSCWDLIGEEIIDTEHPPEEYDAIYAELVGRGFTPSEIDEMRALGSRTLGWLNYEKMLWDWVSLNESDIIRALDLQLEEKKIDTLKYEQEMTYMRRCLARDKGRVQNHTAQTLPENSD